MALSCIDHAYLTAWDDTKFVRAAGHSLVTGLKKEGHNSIVEFIYAAPVA